jgi:predicted nucleic acid-binding protein
MILVDTSIWIDFIRQKDNARTRTLRHELEGAAEIVTCPPILQEVLQGARNDADFKRLNKLFASVPMIDTSNGSRCAVAAAGLFARCRWRGLTLRSAFGCTIAQIAIENDAILFHHDRDFLHIAQVTSKLRHEHYLEHAQ